MTYVIAPDSESVVAQVVHRWSPELMDQLLFDHTAQRNIIWADDEYQALGKGYQPHDEIMIDAITGAHSSVIKTRLMKDEERQARLTKHKAEVFTPSWLCNKMNNSIDAAWFGHDDAFNTPTATGWKVRTDKVAFSEAAGRGWQDYVDCPKLEITCAEAPFLCSRYDTTTGTKIPVPSRIGILDRKLRVVTENTDSYEEWLKWAYRSLESAYGYELQGDNLIIARINMLMTFAEHLHERWGRMPDLNEAAKAARIITWNLWQMDGLTCRPPEEAALADGDAPASCLIFDWRRETPQPFESLRSL